MRQSLHKLMNNQPSNVNGLEHRIVKGSGEMYFSMLSIAPPELGNELEFWEKNHFDSLALSLIGKLVSAFAQTVEQESQVEWRPTSSRIESKPVFLTCW